MKINWKKLGKRIGVAVTALLLILVGLWYGMKHYAHSGGWTKNLPEKERIRLQKEQEEYIKNLKEQGKFIEAP